MSIGDGIKGARVSADASRVCCWINIITHKSYMIRDWAPKKILTFIHHTDAVSGSASV